MKKNKGKLTWACLLMAAVLALSVFFGAKLPKEVNADTALTESYKLVYEVETDDPKVILDVSSTLTKRLQYFGASNVDAKVDGTKVVLTYNDVEDNENIRANMTRTGQISFRNSKDEVLESEGCLKSEQPLAVADSEKGAVLYFFIGDTSAMRKLYTSMLTGGDTMLVVWVDYQEGQKYSTESAKEDPAYLAAATVNSSITSDFYITTTHKFDELRNTVIVANSGALAAPIKEVSFDTIAPAYGEGAVGKLIAGLCVTVVLAALYLAYQYKLAGVVNAVMLIGFAVASLISMSYLQVSFTAANAALFVAGVFVAALLLSLFSRRFAEQLNTGRLVETSLQLSMKNLWLATAEGFAIAGVIGAIGYLAFGKYVSEYGMMAMIFAGCGFIFICWLNRTAMQLIAQSNCFEKENFVNEKAVKLAGFDLAGLLEKKTAAYAIIAVMLAGAVAYALSAATDIRNAMFAVLTVVIAAALIYVYYLLRKERFADKLMPCIAATGALGGLTVMLAGFAGARNGGAVIVLVCLTVVLARAVLAVLNENYHELAKGKLSDERISGMVNSVVGELFNKDALATFVICLLGALIALVICISAPVYGLAGVLAALAVCLNGLVLCGYIYTQLAIKNKNQPRKKKTGKKTGKELKEATIFGINESK